MRRRGGDVRARRSRRGDRDTRAARRVGVRLGVRGAADDVRAHARRSARHGAQMTEWTLSRALNEALRHGLRADDRVLVFGEDVGVSGGVFRVTDGLQAEFGDRRVFDTPISEAAIVGSAVGLAFAGWRPVLELQFDAFSYPAFEQIVDHVAKMRMRTRGRVDMPITIRIPSFGGIKGKEHHGESPETYYAHTAGLKVVVPSNPQDGYALLRHAIVDPDPVVVLEPKARYWTKEDGELDAEAPGIGVGRVLRD